jgi:PPK2 family polyphosphate:nucleotide phosphotransferase
LNHTVTSVTGRIYDAELRSSAVLDALRISPKTSPDLAGRPTDAVPGTKLDKKDAEAFVAERIEVIDRLQQRLFAEGERSLLVVLQGMDTSGKDGAIKKVFRGITPAAFDIAAFKAPSDSELEHDYLWRVHSQMPRRGHIGVFNRSHYEDVVAAHIRAGVSKAQVRKRYRHIVELERMLGDEGTTIVKCFLHITKDEQRERLQARLDDPEKRWKFRAGDLDDRALWDDYQAAYERSIAATSTKAAPWFVVPADRKWLRDVVVAEIVASALEGMDPKLPPDDPAVAGLVVT